MLHHSHLAANALIRNEGPYKTTIVVVDPGEVGLAAKLMYRS